MRHISEMRVRDPFIVPVKEENCYYLLVNNGTARKDGQPSEGLDFYKTADLEHFDGPFPAYRLPEGAAGHIHHGAPEVHRYNGKWYIFDQISGGRLHPDGSFEIDHTILQGDYVFVSDTLAGPYKVLSDGPVTPVGNPCLDGTLYVDKTGQPWMVYSREWTVMRDGTYEAIQLSEDLSRAVSLPMMLFNASAPVWANGSQDRWPGQEAMYPGYPFWVSDAPFMFYDKSGTLCTLWSTRLDNDYVHTFARCPSGNLQGPWEFEQFPMWTQDGGHSMLFKALDGQDMIVFHQSDRFTHERMCFFPIEYTDFGLKMVGDEKPEYVHWGTRIANESV